MIALTVCKQNSSQVKNKRFEAGLTNILVCTVMLTYDTVRAFSKNTQNTDKNEINAYLTTAIPCLRSLKSKACQEI